MNTPITTITPPPPATPVLESVAEVFLGQLRARGIGHFFINAGTDFAPIVEAYARLDSAGADLFPRPVIAGHENVCMGMAHGAYLMSGAPQAVMFHVNVGTANAVCGAMNAARENVPLLVCAGRSPLFEHGRLGARNTRVAWGQEMYDQAAVMRESVKWEYELRGALQVDDVLDRALNIATDEPRGPVYLTLPREVLAAPAEHGFAAQARVAVPARSYPDPAAIALLADRLTAAHMPVISAMASGADGATVGLLAELCERYAIGYCEEQARYLNLPDSHSLHLGFNLAGVLKQADVLLFVECDVPWVPETGAPRADAFVAQAGVDPNFSGYPIRTHRSDLAIKCSPRALFEELARALEQRKAGINPQRRTRLQDQASTTRRAVEQARASELAKDGPITTACLSSVLGSVLHDDCVVFNEYWLARAQLRALQPQSYFYLPATGGLGWAWPAALGARLHCPERTMVAAIGDGTCMFSNPVACHHASQKHALPVLTVVANNARWNAVDSTSRLVYPDGHMTRRAWQDISDLRPAPAFEQGCIAAGGHGALVSTRGELEQALRRALAVVENEQRQALVNVLCV